MPTNIAELFARDPRDHTDDNIRQIISTLREARSKFIIDGSKAGVKALTGKAAEIAKVDLDIKL